MTPIDRTLYVLKQLETRMLKISKDLDFCGIDFNEVSSYKHFQVENGHNSSSLICKLLMLYKILDNLSTQIKNGTIQIEQYKVINLTACNLYSSDSDLNTLYQQIDLYYNHMVHNYVGSSGLLHVYIYLGKVRINIDISFLYNSDIYIPLKFYDYVVVDSFNESNRNHIMKYKSNHSFMPVDPNCINIQSDTLLVYNKYFNFIKPEDLIL